MQNAYNTPAKQMERIKQAGLNPALMYGQGNTGNAMQLSGVSKADVQGPQLAQSAAAGAQISLVNSQRELNKKNAFLTFVEAMRKGGDDIPGMKKIFSNEIALQEADIDKRLQEYRNLKAQEAGVLIDNEIKDKSKVSLIKQASQNLLLTLETTREKKYGNVIGKWRAELSKKGINLNDNFFLRLMGLLLGDNIKNLGLTN